MILILILGVQIFILLINCRSSLYIVEIFLAVFIYISKTLKMDVCKYIVSPTTITPNYYNHKMYIKPTCIFLLQQKIETFTQIKKTFLNEKNIA